MEKSLPVCPGSKEADAILSNPGRVPERPKGAVCKIAGVAYRGSNPLPPTMDDQRARELLQAERRRITDELSGLVLEPVDELSSTDLADDASDLYQEEVDVGRIADLRERLAAVERAEERLGEGRYGISVESGEPIPDARLEAQPTAERTIEEQERFERGGA